MKLHIELLSTLFCVLLTPAMLSAKLSEIDKYHAEIVDMSIDDNLQHPEIPKKYLTEATARMGALAIEFAAKGFKNVDRSERDGLVLMLTIPASELFAPNDTVPSDAGAARLDSIAEVLAEPDMYKLLVVVHSDDTGSDGYLDNLTRARADGIVARFARSGRDVSGVLPYGLGFDEPLNNEQSRAGRAANRRVEFYFVPGPAMIADMKAAGRPSGRQPAQK